MPLIPQTTLIAIMTLTLSKKVHFRKSCVPMGSTNGSTINAWFVPFVENAQDTDHIACHRDVLIATRECSADAVQAIQAVLNVGLVEHAQERTETLQVRRCF